MPKPKTGETLVLAFVIILCGGKAVVAAQPVLEQTGTQRQSDKNASRVKSPAPFQQALLKYSQRLEELENKRTIAEKARAEKEQARQDAIDRKIALGALLLIVVVWLALLIYLAVDYCRRKKATPSA